MGKLISQGKLTHLCAIFGGTINHFETQLMQLQVTSTAVCIPTLYVFRHTNLRKLFPLNILTSFLQLEM